MLLYLIVCVYKQKKKKKNQRYRERGGEKKNACDTEETEFVRPVITIPFQT